MFQVFVIAIILFLYFFVAPFIYRRAKNAWLRYKVRKAGAAYVKCINDYFANLPPKEPQLCKDCKHSELSHNNGNLLCLDSRSHYFGMAVDPDGDKHGMCFTRKEESNQVNAAE